VSGFTRGKGKVERDDGQEGRLRDRGEQRLKMGREKQGKRWLKVEDRLKSSQRHKWTKCKKIRTERYRRADFGDRQRKRTSRQLT
jgi:hypothetical protein